MKEYTAVIAEYCFGFGGKKIAICMNETEAEAAVKKLRVGNPTDIDVKKVHAKNKKEAFAIASSGKSLYAGVFSGMDIGRA